jgi:hypothetical protein
MDEKLRVRIECTPGSNMLEYTHQFLNAYLATHLRPQAAQRLSVAAYELLENAMNYCSVTSHIVLELVESSTWAAVRVSNEAIPARINMLTDHLTRLRSDPRGTFIEEMRRSVRGGGPRAMLGLARIAHEVSLDLDVQVEGGRLTLFARCEN